MTVLSDKQIRHRLGTDVFIAPFREEQLQSTGYDIRLGPNFYRHNPQCSLKYFNPNNGKHITEYWGANNDVKQNYGAEKAMLMETKEQAELYGAKIGDQIILIEPGELILGHTIEFIGSKNNVKPNINARSSSARCGVSICKCSFNGESGFIGIWALEIENHSEVTLALNVGECFGQITFHETGPIDNPYRGSYQDTNDFETLQEIWTPKDILPSLGKKYLTQEFIDASKCEK
jgi:deoxycytidine triphosphate deaminase